MKVPETNSTNVSNVVAVNNRATESAAKAPTTTSPPVQGDAVEVSSLGSRISKLSTHQSEAQASKLSELSSVVSSGRYQVDAQAVSQKMIQEHLRAAA